MDIIQKSQELRKNVKFISEQYPDFTPFNPEIDNSVLKTHLQRGKWSLLHLSASTSSLGTKAFRIIPWLPSSKWPIGDTTTFFESYFYYDSIESYLVGKPIHTAVNKKAYYNLYKANWNSFLSSRSKIFDLFDLETKVDRLENWFFNVSSEPNRGMEESEKYARLKEASLFISDSEENKLLWELSKKYKDDTFIPDLPNIELSIHEERILSSIAERASMHAFNKSFAVLEPLLFQAVMFSHGFGSETSDLKGIASPSDTSLRIKRPIDVLFDEDISPSNSDNIKSLPEFHIASELYRQRNLYDGIPHMEIAAYMDEQLNDPEKAWKYLLSAGFWAGKNLPDAQETILNAAIMLCQKNNWNEAGLVLEYNRDFF